MTDRIPVIKESEINDYVDIFRYRGQETGCRLAKVGSSDRAETCGAPSGGLTGGNPSWHAKRAKERGGHGFIIQGSP